MRTSPRIQTWSPKLASCSSFTKSQTEGQGWQCISHFMYMVCHPWRKTQSLQYVFQLLSLPLQNPQQFPLRNQILDYPVIQSYPEVHYSASFKEKSAIYCKNLETETHY